MLEILTYILIGIVGVTLVAALVYIIGFLVSMLVAGVTGPYEVIKHHHDHPMTV